MLKPLLKMPPSMPLPSARWRHALIGVAVIAVYLVVGIYVRIPMRQALKGLFEGPYWVDHIFFMLTADLVVATLLAWKLVGLGNVYLKIPTDKRAWLVGVGWGLLLVVLIGVALKVVGALEFIFKPDVALMFGNLFSNFYEEYLYRGTLIAILDKYFANKYLAVVASTLVFLPGHLHFPWPLLLVVFFSGLVWGAMILKYRSLLPSWLSHCVMDFIADSIFA